MESVLLTPENNRVHLHTRDDIRAVRIDRLVSENEMTFAHYPALALAIIDEANLALWNQELYTYTQPDTPNLATVDRTFAVWEKRAVITDVTLNAGPIQAPTTSSRSLPNTLGSCSPRVPTVGDRVSPE